MLRPKKLSTPPPRANALCPIPMDPDSPVPEATDDLETERSRPEDEGASPEAPPPKPPRKRRKLWPVILGAIILAGGAAWGGQWWFSRNSSGSAARGQQGAGRPQGVPVQVETVKMATAQETSEFVGNLEAQRSAAIRPERDGRVREIYVRAGDRVFQGEVIARMDSREPEVEMAGAIASMRETQARLAELEAGPRREAIAGARARLSQAEISLAELRAGNRSQDIAQARARLERGEARLESAIAGSRSQEIAAAEARIREAEATLDLSEERLRRNRSLASEGAISRDRLDEVEAENKRALANLQETKARLEELQKSRREAIRDAEVEVEELKEALALERAGARPEEIARAQAEVEERRQELRQLENGTRPEEIARAQAEVAAAAARVRAFEVQLQDTRIVAPFSGTIGDVPVKIGDYLRSGDALTTVTQNDSLELRLEIPIERAEELRLGLPVEIRDAGERPLREGTISFISPRANIESQTLLAKATFENLRGELIDGQFVRAKIIWRSRFSIMVPSNALTYQGERRYIYIVETTPPASPEEQPKLTAKRISVKVGLVEGDFSEILEGLSSGDTIIVSGLQKLSDGAAVMVIEDKGTRDRGTGR